MTSHIEDTDIKQHIRNLAKKPSKQNTQLDINLRRIQIENSELFKTTVKHSQHYQQLQLEEQGMAINDNNLQLLKINSKELPFTNTNNKLNLFSIVN